MPFQQALDTNYKTIGGPTDGQKATYSAAKVGLVPANSATDIFTITAGGLLVRVTRIEIVGTSTAATAAALDVLLLKRSVANTGGTSTGSPTPVAHDSQNLAPSASVLSYTANPSALGAIVGTAIRNQKLMLALATYTATDFPPMDRVNWEFGNRPAQSLVVRTGEVLAVNLNGVTPTATASLNLMIEWSEE